MAKRAGEKKHHGLTPLQREFVFAYIDCDFNGIKAVKQTSSAASTDETRKVLASRWLTLANVQNAIDAELKARRERLRIGADRIVMELAKIAFANADDYYSWDEYSGLTIKGSRELTRAQKAAIASIKETVKSHQVGEHAEVINRTLEFKQYDKQKALELLGKHLGMFQDKLELTGSEEKPLNVNINVNGRKPDAEHRDS